MRPARRAGDGVPPAPRRRRGVAMGVLAAASGAVALAAALPAGAAAPAPAARPAPLVVFNAGSLARPFRDLLQAYTARARNVTPRQEHSGSLEAARKLTELGKIPDLIAVADARVIPSLLVPAHATWHVTFARTRMVLAYLPTSRHAAEVTPGTWWQVLLRPGVRTGRSDPALDPNGYRTLMVLQLAERHYRQAGLADRLLAAMPARYMRPKEADLVALLQAGELDYIWSYEAMARTLGLRWVALPPEIDLGDPALARTYAQARVTVPGARRAGGDSLTVVGEPIVYAMTVPTQAPNRAIALDFVRFVLSPAGREILQRNGFTPLERPGASGPVPWGVLPP